jgi:hypothetical protein
VLKGLYLRNLRWWSEQPLSRANDGILTIGYSYPNQFMAERYNSSGSPYWAAKAFIALAVPENHPFWKADELPVDKYRPSIHVSQVTGLIFNHVGDHTVMLVSGPGTCQSMRWVPEKYNKFAYSSRYGFSIESDVYHFNTGCFDNMIALSDDGKHYRVREECEEAAVADTVLFSKWRPYSDVTVETWLAPAGPWHVRVHRIISSRTLQTIEGGFASPRTDFNQDSKQSNGTKAFTKSSLGDFSGIIDNSELPREARIQVPHGNTNLMFPRTLIPQLCAQVEIGETVLRCAVLAHPNGQFAASEWEKEPTVPTISELEALFESRGVQIEVTKPFP